MTDQEHAGDGKTGFDHIYDQPDPRDYYRTLEALDYEIPQQAYPTFDKLLRSTGAHPATVLDVCCSYGVNAALLRCELGMEELNRHYGDPALDEMDPDELRAADRAFYASRLRPDPPRVLGLDLAAHAIDYGRDIGLLADGWAENLETDEPSPELAAAAAATDLITITGGVGYVTERTFARLLELFPAGRKPLVAAFVLRRYSFDAIAELLTEHGLTTMDTGARTYPQRRFSGADERDACLAALDELGIDATGKEAEGRYHTDLYVAAPAG